jgi:type I restriction enzyme M protein|tara:strand:+ start:189 stop:1889 length:1701 start_codon:yes stop_codon:yes gene_type:complete
MLNPEYEIQKQIQEKIKNNTKFLDEINQYLHNKGVELVKRYDIIIGILLKKETTNVTSDEIIEWVKAKLSTVSIEKNEIYQIIFMFFGNHYFKKQLDQFYTPMTICNFINSLLIPGKTAIDPACGTGDLLNQYQGDITLVDKCSSVLEMTTFIKEHLGNNATIHNKDSLKDLVTSAVKYDYCVLNPPFGTKTLTTNTNILNLYELGRGRKKQEIGILFVELGLKLLKSEGILFAIVPNGYLGNIKGDYVAMRRMIIDKYTLLGIIKLPDNAFARSGTGVATSILVIQNKKPKKKYSIFIEDVKTIGYTLNKKNTPFKYKMTTNGYYHYDKDSNPILDEELTNTKKLFQRFAFKKKISNFKFGTVLSKPAYQSFKKSDIDLNLIFDIKRHLDIYKNTIESCKKSNYKTLRDYCNIDATFKFKKMASQYYYIDIKSVNTPLYNPNLYPNVLLPSRGKYKVEKNDILISKLKGKISFTVITESKENLITSNGFSVIRPKDKKSLVIIFANLFTKEFKIQHQSMVTGSIMETLSDNDIKNIYIKEDIDYEKYNTILSSIAILNCELVSLS